MNNDGYLFEKNDESLNHSFQKWWVRTAVCLVAGAASQEIKARLPHIMSGNRFQTLQ